MSTTTQGSKWLEVPNTAEGNLWLYHQLRKGVDKDAIVAELRKRELYIPDSPIPLDRLVMKPLGPFCYTSDTEIMTKNGIRNVEDIGEGDLVATLDSCGELEWQPITHKYSELYQGTFGNIYFSELSFSIKKSVGSPQK